VHFDYAEVLRFNYPFTTTLLQFFATTIILQLVQLLPHVFRLLLHASKTEQLLPDIPTNIYINDETWSGDTYDGSLHSVSLSPLASGLDGKAILKLCPLAGLIAGDALFSTYVIYNAPLEVFLISRSIVLPLALGLFELSRRKSGGQALGLQTIGATIALSLSCLLATYISGLPHPVRVVFAAFLSAICSAAWVSQVKTANQALSSTTQYNALGANRARYDDEDDTSPLSHTSAVSFLWNLLSYTSVLATIFICILWAFSGELSHISRNCYVLDASFLWIRIFFSAIFRVILFSSSILLVQSTSAFNTLVFVVLVNVSQAASLTFSDLVASQKIGLLGCVVATAWLYWEDVPMKRLADPSKIWGSIRGTEGATQRRKVVVGSVFTTSAFVIYGLFWAMFGSRGDVVMELMPMKETNVNLAPPDYEMRDDYLGPRPHDGAVADLDFLVSNCRGSYEQLEHMRDVYRCLDILSNMEDSYLQIPDINEKDEEKSLDPKKPKLCNGPTVLYHVYWDGPPSWRIELFVKSFLYTQNLPCSKLMVWVNADRKPSANVALQQWFADRRFKRFTNVFSQGYIEIKAWKLPSRVWLPRDMNLPDNSRYYKYPGWKNWAGEVSVADSVIRDKDGNEWLDIYDDDVQLTYFNVAASDAARLTILHLYGGVYMDVDMIFLRDIRPLVLSGKPFAERWGSLSDPVNYNNAVVSLQANSTMSSYLLRGGTRMGHIYHFMAMGRMLVYEGQDDRSPDGLYRLETAFFDPIMAEADRLREGRCTVPCLSKYDEVFKAQVVPNEWDSMDAQPMEGFGYHRTLENFFRGSYAYHVHNQVRISIIHESIAMM
jgi:hypothetical protein